MRDQDKSKPQLINELTELRKRLQQVEEDLVEQQTQLEATQQRLQLLETILDYLPALVYVKGRDSRHIYINLSDLKVKRAASGNNSLQKKDVIGETDEKFFGPEQAAEQLHDESAIIETGHPLIDKEEKFIDENGNARYVLTTKLVWRDEAKQPLGIIGIGADITWLKQGQEILNSINRSIFAAESVNKIMREIVAGAMQLCSASSGIIYMVDSFEGAYQITNFYHYPPESQHPKPRIEMGIGITHEVITTGRVVTVSDTSIEHRSNPNLPDDTRALLAFPLKHGDKVIGVFHVNYTRPHHFTRNEINHLSIMADYAVVALEKAGLLQEKDEAQQQLLALHEASNALTASDDVEAVFKAMTERALSATGADWVSIVLIGDAPNGDGQKVKRLINYPEDGQFRVDMIRPRPKGNSFRIYDSGTTYIVHDIDKKPHQVNPQTIKQGYKSVIGLPLSVGNQRRMGVLWLHYRHKQKFSPSQVRSLELYARQGAIAFDNALRLEKIRQLQQMTQAITNLIPLGDKHTTLRLIVESIHSVINCDALTLYIYNPQRGELEHPPTLLGVEFPERAMEAGTVLHESVVYKILDRNDYCLAPNVHIDPLFKDRPFVHREGIESCLAIPLIAAGHKAGVLFVNYRKPHLFTGDELEIIQTFANLAAIAIQNAQLLNEAKENSEVFASVNTGIEELLSTFDIGQILKKIVDYAIKLTGAADSVIYLIKKENETFTITKEFSTSLVPPYPHPRLGNPEAVTVRVLQTGESLVVDDILTTSDIEIHPELKDLNVKSMIAVPLKSKSTVIGVLYVFYTKPHRFTAKDRIILETLASEAALAISNEQQRRLLSARTALAWIGLAASTWSHSLYRRMAHIRGLSDLTLQMLQQGQPIPNIEKEQRRIIEETVEIRKKIETLRIRAESPSKTQDISRLTHELFKQIEQSRLVSDVVFDIQVDITTPYMVEISVGWLEQLYEILVDNAIDAMKGRSNKRIGVRTGQTGEAITIFISDTGRGIPPEILQLLETPSTFSQNDADKAGLGFGLVIAQAIIDHFQGGFEATSVHEGGTTIKLHFPLKA